MSIDELLKKLSYFQGEDAVPSWKMEHTLPYENDFIKVLRLDSSNKWIGKPHASAMSKMWSIIVHIKKDFDMLPSFRELQKRIKIRVTPVRNNSKHQGGYGIRIYGMNQNPTPLIAKTILDFIFQ